MHDNPHHPALHKRDKIMPSSKEFNFAMAGLKLLPLTKTTAGRWSYNEEDVSSVRRQFNNSRTILAFAFERGDLKSEHITFENPITKELRKTTVLYETNTKDETFFYDIEHLLQREYAAKMIEESTSINKWEDIKAFLVITAENTAGWRVIPGWLIVFDPVPEDSDNLYDFIRPSLSWLIQQEEIKTTIRNKRQVNDGPKTHLVDLLLHK